MPFSTISPSSDMETRPLTTSAGFLAKEETDFWKQIFLEVKFQVKFRKLLERMESTEFLILHILSKSFCESESKPMESEKSSCSTLETQSRLILYHCINLCLFCEKKTSRSKLPTAASLMPMRMLLKMKSYYHTRILLLPLACHPMNHHHTGCGYASIEPRESQIA